MLKVFTLSLLLALISCGKKADDSAPAKPVDDRTTPQRTLVEQPQREELKNAIISNDSLLVDYALKENEDINYQFIDGETPLTKALKFANNSIINKIIEHGADVNLRNFIQETPLNIAIKSKNYNILHILIDKNADLNLLGHNNLSPLANAIFFCNETEAIHLVRAGADINMVDLSSGYNMQELAQLNGYNKLDELMTKAKKHKEVSEKNILAAIVNGDTSFIKYLIERYPEYIKMINLKNMLIHVLKNQNEIKRNFILEYLLSVGAQAHNINGKTPLQYAIENNLYDEMNKLILAGAKLDYRNEELKDALTISVEMLHYNMTQKIYRILKEELNNYSIMQLEQAKLEFDRRMEQTCLSVPSKKVALWINPRGKELRYRTMKLLGCSN